MKMATEIAYLAGILDGEGTIHIIRQNRPKHPYYNAEVCVSNSDLALLNWIKERFGGHITLARRNVGKNWKPVYRLQFYSSKMEELVTLTYPFLVCKKQQAKLILDLRNRMKVYRHPLSVEERAYRRYLYEKSRALNKRGLSDAERLSGETLTIRRKRESTPKNVGSDAIVQTRLSSELVEKEGS